MSLYLCLTLRCNIRRSAPYTPLYYLHGDHLGSAILATHGQRGALTPRVWLPLVAHNADGSTPPPGANDPPLRPGGPVYLSPPDAPAPGTVVAGSETRYRPYGEVRTAGRPVAGLTARTYTGQAVDEATGLMFYNARWYDPALGRFISADTVVPQPGNPQALNRYAYVLNNPLKYTDPTGHKYDPYGDDFGPGVPWPPPQVPNEPPPPSQVMPSQVNKNFVSRDFSKGMLRYGEEPDAVSLDIGGSVISPYGIGVAAGCTTVQNRKTQESHRFWYGGVLLGLPGAEVHANPGLVWNYSEPSDFEGFTWQASGALPVYGPVLGEGSVSWSTETAPRGYEVGGGLGSPGISFGLVGYIEENHLISEIKSFGGFLVSTTTYRKDRPYWGPYWNPY